MSAELPINWPMDGLIPAVIQDATTRDILMVGFMNELALSRTRETGFVHFWSRSREKLWKKGETSGHVQAVREIFVNCEQNSLLIEVDQTGAVCHDGYPTCYYRRIDADHRLTVVRDRWFDPGDVYGGTTGLRAILEQWWGAYTYLRDHDLSGASSTSSRLRDDGTTLVPRIQDELRELAGVLDGSHVHTTQDQDVLLEGSQACYWLACELLRRGASFSAVRPDRALDVAPGDALATSTVATLLRSEADALQDSVLSVEKGHQLFALVANATVSLGVEPLDMIRRDLDDLRGRDYLSPYFTE